MHVCLCHSFINSGGPKLARQIFALVHLACENRASEHINNVLVWMMGMVAVGMENERERETVTRIASLWSCVSEPSRAQTLYYVLECWSVNKSPVS